MISKPLSLLRAPARKKAGAAALAAFTLIAGLACIRISHSAEKPPADDVAKAFEDVSRLQSQGMKEAKAKIQRAYVFLDRDRVFGQGHPPGTQLIAVDVVIDNLQGGYDLNDIDIVDAATNENYGSDPGLFGVLPNGELTDIDDSEVNASQRSRRVLLIYLVPVRVKAVKLEYWGDTLTPEMAVLQQGGPEARAQRIVSARGFSIGGTHRYLLRTEVENWPRERTPYLFIRCAGPDTMTLRRFVEVDAAMRLSTPKEKLPPFVPKRFLLLEYTTRPGCIPRLVSNYVSNYPIESLTSAVPPDTIKALDATPMDPE